MNKQSSIKTNFIMNIILTASTFVFPLITFPYISRVIGAAGIGKVSFAISFTAYFQMFAQLGIPVYGVRACAQVRDDKERLSRITHELFIISVITTIITYSVFLITFLFVPKMQEDKTLMLIVSGQIWLSTIGIEWLYMALEKYRYITIRSIVFKCISVILILMLIHSENDYKVYAAISVFSSGGFYVLNAIGARKFVFLYPVGKYNFKQHFKPMVIFFAMACATTIYTNLDQVMLGFMTTDIDVGYYNVAVRIKGMLNSVVVSLGTVLLPRTSYYIENKDFESFYRVCNKAINYVFVISIPLVLYYIIFAGNIIELLSGSEFCESVSVSIIIMPTIFLVGLNNLMAIQMLVPMGKEKIVLYAEIAGAITDIVLNFFLIPLYKSDGAAVGTLMAEVVVTFICYWVLRKETARGFKSISYWKIVVANAIAVVFLQWMKYFSFDNLFTIIASGCSFFGAYFILLYLMRENLTYSIINQLISKIRKVV